MILRSLSIRKSNGSLVHPDNGVATVVLGSVLAFRLAFLGEGDEPEALADGTVVRMTVKPDAAPSGEAIALDYTASVSGTGSARRYTLSCLVDGTALRALIGDDETLALKVQFSAGTQGAEGYIAALPLALLLVNNYEREDDAVPEPMTDANWEWIKGIFPEGGGVTHDDEAKTIGLNPGAHSHAITDVTGLQAALDGKAPSGHTHAVGDVTGLQGALDGKAASSHTHSASVITSGTLDAARLPAPGVSTLGGVKRNTGTAGQFVSGVDAYGNLTYSTPSGEGGGGTLMRGVGSVICPLSPPPVNPPPLYLTFSGTSPGSTVTVDILYDLVPNSFRCTLSSLDPADGSAWADSTGFWSEVDYASAMASLINGLGLYGISATQDGSACVVNNANAGGSNQLACTSFSGPVMASGGGYGEDATGGGPDVLVSEVIPGVSGKTLYPLRCFAKVLIASPDTVSLVDSSGWVFATWSSSTGFVEFTPPDIDTLALWMGGSSPSSGLTLKINDGTGGTQGTEASVWVVVEQV